MKEAVPLDIDFSLISCVALAMQAGHMTVEAEVAGQWAVHVTFGKKSCANRTRSRTSSPAPACAEIGISKQPAAWRSNFTSTFLRSTSCKVWRGSLPSRLFRR